MILFWLSKDTNEHQRRDEENINFVSLKTTPYLLGFAAKPTLLLQ